MSRTFSILACAATATLLLSSCAYGGGGYGDYAVAGGDYDGFYDDYYGPFADGYWGPDNFFYYSDATGHPFRRDENHHFRHDAAPGFHAMHGHHAAGRARVRR